MQLKKIGDIKRETKVVGFSLDIDLYNYIEDQQENGYTKARAINECIRIVMNMKNESK